MPGRLRRPTRKTHQERRLRRHRNVSDLLDRALPTLGNDESRQISGRSGSLRWRTHPTARAWAPARRIVCAADGETDLIPTRSPQPRSGPWWGRRALSQKDARASREAETSPRSEIERGKRRNAAAAPCIRGAAPGAAWSRVRPERNGPDTVLGVRACPCCVQAEACAVSSG